MSYDDELIKMLKSVIEIVDKIPEAPPSSDDKYDQIRDLANDVREKYFINTLARVPGTFLRDQHTNNHAWLLRHFSFVNSGFIKCHFSEYIHSLLNGQINHYSTGCV